MGLAQVKFDYAFGVIDCATCGMPFGMTPDFQTRRRDDHRGFYCPSGHVNTYAGETDLEKERRKSQMLADQVRMEREERLKAERQLQRVAKGVCPKCNRSFKALERHMKTQHGAKKG